MEQYNEDVYISKNIYNVDESSFGIGDSSGFEIFVSGRSASNWKVIKGKQEWITSIECISAADIALSSIIIFKTLYTNAGWILVKISRNWIFSTSNKDWTTDGRGYQWLLRIFAFNIKPNRSKTRRFLIMYDHSSHITADIIRFCIKNKINLMILPPYTSYIL